MAKAISALALSAAYLLTGCNVYRVKVHTPEKPSGIPFFAVTGVCSQETVYALRYVVVTLKITGASGVITTDSVKLDTPGLQSEDFQNLLAQLEKQTPELSSVQTAWGQLRQHKAIDPYTQGEGQFLLSNTRKTITTVDYSHEYSLNQRKPIAGSVSSDYKLNGDGTLSEVQGQTQDDTLSTILGALPLSDLIKSAAGIAAKTGAAAAQPGEPVKFSLEQEERIRTKTYSNVSSYAANCPPAAAISDPPPAGTGVVISDVGAKDSTGKGDSTKDDSSIGITGTIKLPKGLIPPAKKDDTGKPETKPGAESKPSSDSKKGDSGGKPTSKKGKSDAKSSDKTDDSPAK